MRPAARPGRARSLSTFASADRDRHQVGLGEVAIVARLFLVPLAAGDVGRVVPAAGLLGHVAQPLAGLLPDFVLPLGLVLHRPLDGPEAVHVLDFDDRRGDRLPVGRVDVQVDVGVDAQAPFLHVAVGDAQIGEQQLQLVR